MLEHRDDLAVLMASSRASRSPRRGRGRLRGIASRVVRRGGEARLRRHDPRATRRTGASSCSSSRSASAPAITPWNFPVGDDHAQGGAGARGRLHDGAETGEQTPLSALALAELAERAGMPAGVFNVVTGAADARDRRRADFESGRAQARVHGLDGGRQAAHGAVREHGEESLTRARRQRAVHRVRRRRPGRGGRGAMLLASSGTPARPASARTVCSSRRASTTRSRRSWPTRRRALNVGAGLEEGVTQGPADRRQAGLEKVEEHVADALERARRVSRGGKRHELGRPVLPAHRARRRDRSRWSLARGDVRAGRRRCIRVRDGGGGDRARERHAVRARRLLVRPRRRPRLAGRRGAGDRDRRHQHRLHLDRGGAVRRRQGVRASAAKARSTGSRNGSS